MTHICSLIVGQGIFKIIWRAPEFQSGYNPVDAFRCNNLDMLACFISRVQDDIFKPWHTFWLTRQKTYPNHVRVLHIVHLTKYMNIADIIVSPVFVVSIDMLNRRMYIFICLSNGEKKIWNLYNSKKYWNVYSLVILTYNRNLMTCCPFNWGRARTCSWWYKKGFHNLPHELVIKRYLRTLYTQPFEIRNNTRLAL